MKTTETPNIEISSEDNFEVGRVIKHDQAAAQSDNHPSVQLISKAIMDLISTNTQPHAVMDASKSLKHLRSV